MKVEELMAEVGLHSGDGGRIREAWLSADCPGCNREIGLPAMTIKVEGDETEYLCSCGIVTVAINWTKMVDGHYNYMLKGDADRLYILTPVKALYTRIPGAQPVVMPGGPRTQEQPDHDA